MAPPQKQSSGQRQESDPAAKYFRVKRGTEGEGGRSRHSVRFGPRQSVDVAVFGSNSGPLEHTTYKSAYFCVLSQDKDNVAL